MTPASPPIICTTPHGSPIYPAHAIETAYTLYASLKKRLYAHIYICIYIYVHHPWSSLKICSVWLLLTVPPNSTPNIYVHSAIFLRDPLYTLTIKPIRKIPTSYPLWIALSSNTSCQFAASAAGTVGSWQRRY